MNFEKLKPTAIILGGTGQDGTLLRNLLFKKNYNVVCTTRKLNKLLDGLSAVRPDFKYVQCNLENSDELKDIIGYFNPEKVFLLSAQSSVSKSFDYPIETSNSILIPLLNILEIIKESHRGIKLFHASSSEVFGNTETPAKSTSPFKPLSPYGAAKAHASELVRIYRESYDLYLTNGFLFNHESNLRGDHFVTKKIINYVKAAQDNIEHQKLSLGNLTIVRDWGLAREYVVGMDNLLELYEPQDCVFCTGVQMTLSEFLYTAFKTRGLDINKTVEVKDSLKRANDLETSVGNPHEAEHILRWSAKTKGPEVVHELLEDNTQIHEFE